MNAGKLLGLSTQRDILSRSTSSAACRRKFSSRPPLCQGRLPGLHMFVGLLLIPPVALKLASTGYRFVRYYTASPAYRRKAPPPRVRLASAESSGARTQ